MIVGTYGANYTGRHAIGGVWGEMYDNLITFYNICMVAFLLLSKTLESSSDICSISNKTVQVVQRCPDNLQTWMEAAKRKNCSAYASQCSEPDRLAYHCVLNPYANETLEVCAYVQNIVLGFCTEYSISGSIIQQNYQKDCMDFKDNPCPYFYLSTDCYKYPDCYNITKESQISTDQRLSINHLNVLRKTTLSYYISYGTHTTFVQKSNRLLWTAALPCVIIIFILILFCWKKLMRRRCKNKRLLSKLI